MSIHRHALETVGSGHEATPGRERLEGIMDQDEGVALRGAGGVSDAGI